MDYYNLDKSETFLISLKAYIKKDNKILVVKFPESKNTKWIGEWNGKWGLPGGLLIMKEDIEIGLLREVSEETGLKVKINKVFAVGSYKLKGFIFKDKRRLDVHIVELGFLCEYNGGKVILSSEHSEYKWVNKKELAKLVLSPDSKDLITQYLI